MNKENTQKLIEAGPKLFCTIQAEQEKMQNAISGKPTSPFMPIAFGFECGDGWFDLLLECVTSLEAEINNLPEKHQSGIVATQVKEKYGTLRFYLSSETDTMAAIICKAEMRSALTCEHCGKPGKRRGEHWISTLCEDCSDKKHE